MKQGQVYVAVWWKCSYLQQQSEPATNEESICFEAIRCGTDIMAERDLSSEITIVDDQLKKIHLPFQFTALEEVLGALIWTYIRDSLKNFS